MTIVAILVALLVVLVAAFTAVALRRRRTATRSLRDDKKRVSSAEDTSPAAADPASGPTVSELTDPVPAAPVLARSPRSTNTWDAVEGTRQSRPDPAGPPAVIHMAVTGTHPWAPARIFLTELQAEGYQTTVKLPDLVVVRDDDRRPVTVREPTGPPGRLIVTAEPGQLAKTLEVLVRSLLADAFTVDATDGRDVRLTDDEGTEICLTLTELALAY